MSVCQFVRVSYGHNVWHAVFTMYLIYVKDCKHWESLNTNTKSNGHWLDAQKLQKNNKIEESKVMLQKQW